MAKELTVSINAESFKEDVEKITDSMEELHESIISLHNKGFKVKFSLEVDSKKMAKLIRTEQGDE